jgi:carboxypeptidase T
MRRQMTAHLRLLLLFFAALPVLLIPIPAGAQDLGDHDIVSFKKSPEMMQRLRRLDLDLLMERDGRIYAVVGARDLLRLTEELLPFRIDTASAGTEYPAAPPLSIQGGINGDFHSYGEAESDLFLLEQTYPAIAKVYDVGDSLEGRNLYAVKLSDNVETEENEAKVLFLGCHHAREWIAVDVPLMIAQHLAANYASDSQIRSLLDQSEVWILPVVNPDGLEYSIHVYRYWRKNRRDNGSGSYGVDLNRNYGYQWGYDDIGSSGNANSGTYRGPAPFSEPESRAVRDLVEAHDFLALISYHNYSQIILYPWGYIEQRAPQDALLEYLASNMTARMAAVRGVIYEYGPAGDSLYTTNGDTTDWALGSAGVPAFTIELPPPNQSRGGFFNAEAEIVPIFQENLPAALFLIEWAVDQYTSSGGGSGGGADSKRVSSHEAGMRREESGRVRGSRVRGEKVEVRTR